MAPRRSRKVVKVAENNVFTDLTLNKIMCPICRTILIEPVSLPCSHSYCLCCFNNTMANANLVCPLCRIRVGSWYRNAKKMNRLVNIEFWKAIKEQFAVQVQNKLDGIDEIYEDEDQPLIKIASPGAIRKEYENEKQRDDAELRQQRDLESKASEELIKKLAAEEEFTKTVEEEKLRMDREVAKQIARGFMDEAGPSNATITTKGKKQVQLDRFLKKNQMQKGKGRKQKVQKLDAEVSDSSDCIESECRYFKPIDYKSVPPSKALSPIKIPTRMGSVVDSSISFMGAPQGPIKFNHNSITSAFIAVRCSSMKDDIINEKTSRRNGSMCIESNTIHTKLTKRPSIRSDEVIIANNKKAKKSSSPPSQSKSRGHRQKQKQQPKRPESPPCYGFETTTAPMTSSTPKLEQMISNGDDGVIVVNNNWESEEMRKKRLQEAADLEFAKKLQEEFNGYGRYSTRQGCARRQVTLDELLKAQSKLAL